MVVSSATTPSVASRTSRTTCAIRMFRRAITTLSFSAISWVLPLRRIPAVSTKIYSTPSRTSVSSTASRVVPAIGETIERSLPVRALSRVDLPTFGRPIIATLIRGFESYHRVPQDLRRDKRFIIRDDPSGVDNFEVSFAPCSFAVNAITSDTRLIADDRSTLPGNRIEEGRFPDVRAAYNDDRRR